MVRDYLLNGGMQAALIGSLVATAFGFYVSTLIYRIVRGSWRSKTDTRLRRFAAYGAALGAVVPASRILNGILWADNQEIISGLVGLFLLAPIFAGMGAIIGRIFEERPDEKLQNANLNRAPQAPTLK